MKLHLPKVLCMAVMAAMACTTAQAVEAVVDVGFVDTSVDATKHSIITAKTTDVTVGKDQAAGAFTTNDDGNKVLTTSFGSYTDTANNAVISNHLKVSGKLTINDNGQVYLGGQVKKTGSRDAYGGLIADSVEINGDGSVTNLDVGTATIGTLTLNSGKVRIHKEGTPSGNSYAATVGTDCKTVTINKAVNVNGGLLDMGYEAQAGSGKSHYQAFFSNGAKINQTDGTIKIAGQTRLNSGVSITQSGGTFDTPTTEKGQLAFELGSGSYTINQINPESGEDPEKQPELTIRRLAAASTTKLDITQTADKGIINLTAGTNVAGTVFELKNTSTLKQDTVTGVINLNGDFSGATYNVEQSGSGTININSDCKFVANELSVGGDAKLNIAGSLTLNEGGTFKIAVNSAHDAAMNLGDNGTFSIAATTQALSLSLHEAVVSDMMDTVESATESGLLTYTIDLISATDKGTLEDLKGKLTWEWEGLPETAALAADTLTTVVTYDYIDSKLIVNDMGDGTYMLQAATNWNVTVTEPIPEPATATLSLLALAGLAARRRRR